MTLKKEIKAYNLDETTINALTISYTNTIAPATVAANTTVTDAVSMHDDTNAVTVPVKAGVGTPTIANSGVVAWTTADQMTAGTDGASNTKDIVIDFSGVAFTAGPGVYRYELTEALTSGYTYASSGVTGTGGTHSRFIDVYVIPAEPTPEDKSYSDPEYWQIYGYTCLYNNATVTEANKGTVAVKTQGFVAGTSDGTTPVSADSYYTFNVIVKKTVEKDAYGASTVAFPFTVIFTNGTITKNVDVIGSVKHDTVTGWTDPAAGALSSTNGIVNIGAKSREINAEMQPKTPKMRFRHYRNTL